MSKRSREEGDNSECAHQCHKRLKDDHGDMQRVSPQRFDQTFRFEQDGGATVHDDPFQVSLADHPDEDNDNKMSTHSRSSSLDANHANPGDPDGDFGVLLYELASLNVGHQSNPDEQQTCPICSARVSLRQFPDHVHNCLDKMDEGDLDDMRSQTEKDSDFATAYARKHGYVMEYTTECPSCGKRLFLGSGMNEHVNLCMDEMLRRDEAKQNLLASDDEDEDSDIEGNPMGNSPKKVEPMSRAQMIECASKLMTLQQGSHEFDSMLGMFGALGFNKENVKSVLEIEKQQSAASHSNSNHNSNSHDDRDHALRRLSHSSSGSPSREPTLNSIPEEDVDLGDRHRNDRNRNVAGPGPGAGPVAGAQEGLALMIDDDDL